ncbi:class I SAM-dependent methyltransferase [Geomonas edaphica]|uniref:class I SAM-dependent methyltransferase n=1 Tax=Geomonas edaphica TaxID=2570226 RepID=UPI0010A7786D|nr:methyltransferase domain-containing protein [Geomonas edaphica]
MDLREADQANPQRHPWETARLRAVRRIIAPSCFKGMTILDIGCGDAFAARGLFADIPGRSITAVDTSLTDAWIERLSGSSNGITFRRTLPESSVFDMVLLLDVMEHVEDDRQFLAKIVEHHLGPKGRMMITVPAFQSLFSAHDRALGHYRRYRLPGLVQVASACGLKVQGSGYLFSSLLLPKLLLFKVLRMNDGSEGVGQWRRGAWITFLVEKTLRLDNALLTAAARIGIKIPGLTAWVLCEKS